ncbi:unnamed protein product [[Actinomadura] parvosata subsp. kistnae]|uniref:Uncharacterized protein n=1 Tax=[Actinomadura] parvosata subsp. kistnae TaxID=1909395 RepID=A0A1V0A720_9ACTN|nr:hypothetical protein [Nonomuraea sp. ATCC 55076]AQZ65994.1 hypothetical protein BKM31_35100 [Nonomuraea sp. ATCC 55076]SPL97462.1 unnamed protein product [Actinomadura parvosata subsp. kistnae]
MTRTVLTAALLAALFSGLAAGCGAQQSGGGVASVTTTSTSATPAATATASASADPQERGRKFAQCMRDHGVPMEDPAPDGSGGLSVIAKKGDGKTKDALEACRELAPIKDRDELTPEDLDKLREFAKCMRDNGVNMPDPAPDGSFGGAAGSIKRDDPAFTKAFEACRATFPKIGGGK